MDGPTRRAAWVLAAASIAGAGVWIAADAGGAASSGPRTSGVPETRPNPPSRASAAAARRDARRSAAAVAAAASIKPPSALPPDAHAAGKDVARAADVAARAAIVANLRPPPASGTGRRVVARGWTPAKDALSPPSGRRPDTRAPRDASATTTDSDAPLDKDAVDLASTHGLRGDYFDFLEGEITDIPDVAGLPPTFSRIDLAIDFDTDASFATPFDPDTFAVRWTGSLRVPDDAAYRFVCGSDDGVRVKIDGKVVVDQPRLRAYGESSGSAALSAGKHPIEIVFYENYGYASCRLWWSSPTMSRRIVAPAYLTPPDDLADFTPPVIASIDPPSGFVDDVVTVSGVGFGGAPVVTFDGVAAEVQSADAGRIAVKVPVGAASGDVVVTVDGISSLPRKFVVENLLGLYGEYFKCDGELKDYPDFDHMAPYFVRLDPNLDFMDDNLWKVPYDPDVFGARFTGFLYFPEDDDYRVTLGSDDGARLSLDDKLYVEMPGLHPYQEQSRTTHFAKGFHPVEVLFFENYGAARLALYWQRASDVTRTVIPAGFFYAPRALSDLPPPTIASLAPSAAEIGGDLAIDGSGFGADARLVRVVFPGDVWARPTAVDDAHVHVQVPYGATAGGLHVEVGVQSGNSAAFGLATPQGLVADYFTFVDRDSLAAVASPDALSKLTPAFTRVETGWQRTATKDWNLPFPATAFAVHWHGTLGVAYPTDVGWILRSAAGAWLSVDGVLADDCGPWHELEERYGGSHLAPGEHRFDLWFMFGPLGSGPNSSSPLPTSVQSDAEPRIQLLYTPVGRLDHLPVPGSWFLPREPRTGR